MTRNHRSARTAGTRFERQIADTLAAELRDDRIDRRPRRGARDRGDIGGVRTPDGAGRIVIEVKNTTRTDLPGWAREAEAERLHDQADLALVISKRVGKTDPLDAWVHMTVRDLIVMLSGRRP